MVETEHEVRVFAVPQQGPAIADESAALDIIGEAFGADAQAVSIPVARLTPEFFQLHTGVAGAIVQTFVNYRLRLVVVGDPQHHGPASGPVEDWIREANQGRELWFVADHHELERRLAPQS